MPLPKPSEEILFDYSLAILVGGLKEVGRLIVFAKELVLHPSQTAHNTLFPITSLVLDAAIILSRHPLVMLHDSPEFRAWQTTLDEQNNIYPEARQRMQTRISTLESTVEHIIAAKGTEKAEMLSGIFTGAWVLGKVLKGVGAVHDAVQNKSIFGTYTRPSKFRVIDELVETEALISVPPQLQFMTLEEIRALPGQHKYMYAITEHRGRPELLITHEAVDTPYYVRKTEHSGIVAAYDIRHAHIGGFQPAWLAGNFFVDEGYIAKIGKFNFRDFEGDLLRSHGGINPHSGHYRPVDLYPNHLETLAETFFKNFGFTEAPGKFEKLNPHLNSTAANNVVSATTNPAKLSISTFFSAAVLAPVPDQSSTFEQVISRLFQAIRIPLPIPAVLYSELHGKTNSQQSNASMILRAPEDVLEYAHHILKGGVNHVLGWGEIAKHPLQNFIYPVSRLIYHASIVALANMARESNDPLFKNLTCDFPEYQAALADIAQRIQIGKQESEKFNQSSGPEKAEIIAEAVTGIFLPGTVIRAVVRVAKMAANLKKFGTTQPALFHNLSTADLALKPPAWTAETPQSMATRSGSLTKYIWVILEDNTLVVAVRELLEPVLCHDGFTEMWLRHPELAKLMPVRAAGTIEAYGDFIHKITNKTGHYRANGPHFPEYIENVFLDNGYISAKGKFVFAEIGDKVVPTVTYDPSCALIGPEVLAMEAAQLALRGQLPVFNSTPVPEAPPHAVYPLYTPLFLPEDHEPPILIDIAALHEIETEKRYIYVLTEDGQLTIGPRHVDRRTQFHYELADSKRVIIAGEIFRLADGFYCNNHSYHYKPTGAHVEPCARDTFGKIGITLQDFTYLQGTETLDMLHLPPNVVLPSSDGTPEVLPKNYTIPAEQLPRSEQLPLFKSIILVPKWYQRDPIFFNRDSLKNMNPSPENQIFNYVITEQNVLLIGPCDDPTGRRQGHDRLACYQKVICAGQLIFLNGKWSANNSSGHYIPRGSHLSSYVKRVFKDQAGIEIGDFEYVKNTEKLDMDRAILTALNLHSNIVLPTMELPRSTPKAPENHPLASLLPGVLCSQLQGGQERPVTARSTSTSFAASSSPPPLHRPPSHGLSAEPRNPPTSRNAEDTRGVGAESSHQRAHERHVPAHPKRSTSETRARPGRSLSSGTSLQRAQILTPQTTYERTLAAHMASITQPTEAQRGHFAKMGMREKPYRSQSSGQHRGQHRALDVFTGHWVECIPTSAGEWVYIRLPFAAAEAHEGPRVNVQRINRVTPDRTPNPAAYYPRVDPTFASHTTHSTTNVVLPVTYDETNAMTAKLSAAQRNQLSEAKQSMHLQVQQTQAASTAQTKQLHTTQENFSTASSVFGIAASFSRYAGNQEAAAFFSSVSQIASGISTLLTAKLAITAAGHLTAGAAFGLLTGGLSLVAGLVSLIAFFDDSEAAAARARAKMIEKAFRALQTANQDISDEIHEFVRLLQQEIRLVGALSAEVLADQETAHQMNVCAHDEVETLQSLITTHRDSFNTYFQGILKDDLKRLCYQLQSYLDGTGVQPSPQQIAMSLSQLEYWLMCELYHPSLNHTALLHISAQSTTKLLQQQSLPFITMPSFMAGRMRMVLGESVPLDFLSLPPITLYFPNIQLYCKVLERNPEFLGKDKGKSVFAEIKKTLVTYGELFVFLKAHERAIWQSPLTAIEKERISAALKENVDYETGIQQMLAIVDQYQQKFSQIQPRLTDAEKVLETIACKFFFPHGAPDTPTCFWTKKSAAPDEKGTSYFLACSEFDDDLSFRRKFINRLAEHRLKAIRVDIAGQPYLQVTFETQALNTNTTSVALVHSTLFFSKQSKCDENRTLLRLL